MKFVFFGTNPLALDILNTLFEASYTPSLIVAGQDIQTSKKTIEEPVEKQWAKEHNIPFIQPSRIDEEVLDTLQHTYADVFIVASYGKILPQKLLNIPKKGVINVHPSLLPSLRGPSPMRSALLEDKQNTGVSIMLLDDKMDHGPILAQKRVSIDPWPVSGHTIDTILSKEGAVLLLHTLPQWIEGLISPQEQDHTKATYCKEFTKQDGLLDLTTDPYTNFLKICAYDGWPGTYFFVHHNGRDLRIKITDAEYKNNQLIIKKVVPEGKKEMNFADFERGYKTKAD